MYAATKFMPDFLIYQVKTVALALLFLRHSLKGIEKQDACGLLHTTRQFTSLLK